MKGETVVAFVWDNFGPMHADRCDAVAKAIGPDRVIGIELFADSVEYAWHTESGTQFRKLTLFPDGAWRTVSSIRIAKRIVSTCLAENIRAVFLCNYDRISIFLAGLLLRVLGRSVYVMGCSKFDDVPRDAWREVLKRTVFFLPYQGAIASGLRSKDYMRFLGIPQDRVLSEYNTLSVERIRRLASIEPAPGGCEFAQRHFTIVARFVPKKNLFVALDAYARYHECSSSPRPLHLCGSGSLEPDLRSKCEKLGIANDVVFHGFLQTDKVAAVLGKTLALLLPSIEEQFGNVVIEAQAMGVPTILSDVCGARDNLVRSGVNGFVVESDNSAGMAFFMGLLCRDVALWTKMSSATGKFLEMGDVLSFSQAVQKLVDI